MPAKTSKIDQLIEQHRVIICCGSGGVGKTTTSAALAIRAAMLGKRSIVVTIDPAKRLATSLGLQSLDDHPVDLTEQLGPHAKGSFHAVMPDTARTFENFVQTMAGENQGLASRVLRSSIYRIFAKEFAGTNEYMAMEKLHAIHAEGRYDLIVLDTPPSANTRQFLEAPQMLAGFFDDHVMKWLLFPGHKLMASGIKKLMELLERLTGHGFISELIEFTAALFELRGQFMGNLRAVDELLHRNDVGFLMVTSPERLSKQDTQDFVRILSERQYKFWGFVVNRVIGKRLGIAQSEAFPWQDEAKRLGLTPEEASLAVRELQSLDSILEHERQAARFLTSFATQSDQWNKIKVIEVPEQQADVHSMAALITLSDSFDP